MKRIMILTGIFIAFFLSVQTSSAEIILKTEEAKIWERENANNRLVRLKDQEGIVQYMKDKKYNVSSVNSLVVLRIGWDHSGHSSQSTATRDNYAARALFNRAQKLIEEWNKKFGGTAKTFGGIEYQKTEGGWSKTRKNKYTGKRTYKAGGTSVGFILVAP